MNNLNDSITQVATLVSRAQDFENQGLYESAIEYYKQALSLLSTIVKNKNNDYIKDTLLKKMLLYKQRSEELEEIIRNNTTLNIMNNRKIMPNNNIHSNTHQINNNNGQQFTMINNNNNNNDNSYNTNDDGDTECETKYSNKKLKNIPKVTFQDIIGLDSVKKLLTETITLPYDMPQLFTGNRKPAQSILFYGAPGNGKTELARALANTSKMNFYSISYSDIVSKYVGESENNVTALFDEVKSNKPSILFIDEVDSIFVKRGNSSEGGGDGGGSKTKVLQECLKQLDGICEVTLDGVLLVGATNRPWDLDDAAMRRFSHSIYIPMPSNLARQQLFKKYISKNDHNIGDLEFAYFAGKTDNYSASDIANVCRNAAMGPVRRISESNRFHRSEIDGTYIVCPTQNLSTKCLHSTCINIAYQDITDKEHIVAGPIIFDDVNHTLTHIKSSVDLTILHRIETWASKK